MGLGGFAELLLKRKLSLPVSRIWQWWVSRSSRAVVILASPKTVAHSEKLRLVWNKLAAQISQTVRWSACLQTCREAGATAFLELGPGHALADMTAPLFPAPARSLSEFTTMACVGRWLRSS